VAPVKIVNVEPTYPAIAVAARKEGIVILETVIDAEGRVESVRVLRGVPLLDEAAVGAVRQWRFTPARLNCQPVPVVMTVTVNFQLSK
jgi:periplasmic protein TonB